MATEKGNLCRETTDLEALPDGRGSVGEAGTIRACRETTNSNAP